VSVTKVPEEIKYFRYLESLLLDHNRLSSVFIPEEITKLKTLDVSFNELESFPEGLNNQRNLVYLHVSDNKITHVPENVYNLKKLYTLDISNNRLIYISEDIVKLINLRNFWHSGNNIQKLFFY
jgi:internalin A